MKPRLALLLAISSTICSAAEFDWPGHGKIFLDVPKTWALTGRPATDVGFALKGQPKSPANAGLTISVIRTPNPKTPATPDFRRILEGAVQPYLKSSVEKKFSPVALGLKTGTGWFAEFTDAALVGQPAQKGNHKVLRSGIADLQRNTIAVISMSFDDPMGDESAEMLAIVESLRFEPGAASAPSARPPSVGLRIERTDTFYKLHDPDGKLVLKIPRRDLVVQGKPGTGGATESPRYFLLTETSSDLALSGWMEPASDYAGLEQFWKDETAAAKKAKGFEAKKVRFSKHDGWDLIAYDVSLPVKDVNNTHIRAELVRNGTWIDLHARRAAGRALGLHEGDRG
jgi:hypothetical protein